jgi:tellurium resistance protein TerZ
VVNLTKGQSVRLEKSGGGNLTKVFMGVGWDVKKASGFGRLFGGGSDEIDLDASCLLFSAGGEALDAIWFQQLQSKDGSIVHTGDNRTGAGDGDDEQIIIDLSRVPGNIKTLVFVVSSFTGETFDKIENAFCRLVDATTNAEMARFDLSGAGPHTGQIMGKLTRAGENEWSMTAIGQKTTGRTFHDMMPAITMHL